MIACEDVPLHPDFLPLAGIPHVALDLRYAQVNNFVGRPFYNGLDCAYLRREAAHALAKAAHWCASQHAGTRLLVLDALRPQRVQEQLYQELEGGALAIYLAHPVIGSIHSFGMAVDVTVVDREGREWDMGTGFDEMSLVSHPEHEAEHLALGQLTAQQLHNRGWLRAAMRHAGFQAIPTEWWHFDFGEREVVRRDLPRVR